MTQSTMSKLSKTKNSSKIMFFTLLMFLSITAVASTKNAIAQTNNGTTNQWGMDFQTVGPNGFTTAFSPFSEIQLWTNLTYGNVPYAGMLVSFKIQGPSNSSNLNNITRIAITDGTGVAQCSFHLPADAQESNAVIGTWEAYATAQTTTGSIQKNITFTTNWSLSVSSIVFINSQGQNQTFLHPGDYVTAQLSLTNDLQSTQTTNITICAQDSNNQTINQTQLQSIQILPSSPLLPSTTRTSFLIPKNISLGLARINATIYSGNYQGIQIQASETKTVYFRIISQNTSVLGSLFPWLLLATGLITFTLLFTLYRRRHKKMIEQKPKFAPTTPLPSMPLVGGLVQSTTSEKEPKTNEPKPTPQPISSETTMTQPQPRVAHSSYARATLPSETAQISPPQVEKSTAQSALNLSGRDSIDAVSRRIQLLKDERQQINHELVEMKELAETRAKLLENETDAIKEEIRELKDLINGKAVEKQKMPEYPPKLNEYTRIQAAPLEIAPEIVSEIATDLDEERRLIEAGYEFVTEVEGAKIFKRRQRHVTRTATKLEETRRLIENDFQYVTEIGGTKIFRAKEKFAVEMAKTVEDAIRLSEAGYDYIADLNGAKVFRKKIRD